MGGRSEGSRRAVAGPGGASDRTRLRQLKRGATAKTPRTWRRRARRLYRFGTAAKSSSGVAPNLKRVSSQSRRAT